MITPGYKAEKLLIDYNEKLERELGDRELDEHEAKASLAQFFRYNLGFLAFTLCGFMLAPYQRLVIKTWFARNFSLTIAGRGTAKSTMCAVFCILYCILNKDRNILIVSATFRSSRQILEKIDGWAAKKIEGFFLRQCFIKDMTKKQDLYQIQFHSGCAITCVPLGNPDRLRGFRCHVLFIDEGLLIGQATIDNVLKPFLIAGADIKQKMIIRERENRLIAEGKMKEEERVVFESDSKMIILSSASYTWEHLHTIYQDYLKKIYTAEDFEERNDGAKIAAKYSVQQFSYRLVPETILDPAVLQDIKSGSTPEDTMLREYEARFTSNSSSFFSAKKMFECTIPDGQEPTLEIRGEKGAEYVIGIDPNVSASPTADNFAMCVMKVVTRPSDGKKVGMVVHQYATCGIDMKYHILYFLYLLQYFNIVYIACDTTSGANLYFINMCNESEIFKQEKIQLNPIDAEFGRENFQELNQQIKRSYDLMGKRIVQEQSFHSTFQRAANEYLKGCFDFKNIYFGGKINATDKGASLLGSDIGNIYKIHPLFQSPTYDAAARDGTLDEFISYQDMMQKQVQEECVSVDVKTNALGTTSYDLPQSMKRSKDPKRRRKDSYSALLLCNWALRLYVDSRDLPDFGEADLGGAMLL